jgi:division protein CdvB (Snf7/Vps24/ESCRT-III family)
MRHPKRLVLVKAQLEKRLAKNEKRIQRIAEESYNIRKAIAQIDEIEAAKALPVEEKANVG